MIKRKRGVFLKKKKKIEIVLQCDGFTAKVMHFCFVLFDLLVVTNSHFNKFFVLCVFFFKIPGIFLLPLFFFFSFFLSLVVHKSRIVVDR